MVSKQRDRWPQLCQSVQRDDGLPTRMAGTWTEEKLWWWNRYIEITTTALVGRAEWPNTLVYVDLFAGPGILKRKGSGLRLPGSPVIAANAPKRFEVLLFCEKRKKLADACKARLASHGAMDRSVVFVGDCNVCVSELCQRIPRSSLTLAFIDPTGLHANFNTIDVLTSNQQVDLLILFADYMDIIRNVAVYANQGHSNLDDVLGPGNNWRELWRNLTIQDPSNLSKLFIEIYRDQLRKHMGYKVFADEPIGPPQGPPLYRLMFASRHKLGLKFWKISTARFRTGGRLF